MNAGPALLQQSARAIGELPEFGADGRFAQHLVINVPDMEAAITFYTKGLNFQVEKRSDRHGCCFM